MRSQKEEAHGLGVILLQDLANGEEVAQTLGHLFVVDPNETVVHPDAGQRFAVCALALCNFVLVMRELQVGATAMNIKTLAQGLATHGRALDVPARATLAVGAVPLGVIRLLRLGRFPQHKVQRIILAVIHGNPLAGTQVIQRLARELAVAWKLAHRIVHIAIARLVGQALGFELTDQAEHLWHVLGCTRLQCGGLDAEFGDVQMHGFDHLVGQRANADAAFNCALDDLVVNIRDVAHIGHAVPAALEPALHHIESHHHARVPNVAQVINRHAANIHADMA